MTKAQLKRRLKKLFSVFLRIRLKNKDFSIISNNCWGGVTYDKYGLPYLSPTIGCYFFANDFLKFCRDIKKYVSLPIQMISFSESKHKDELEKKGETKVIIGRIDEDIEVIFLHYHSPEEAKSKWERRCKRLNYNNILIKMNDQNSFKASMIDDFKKLPWENKIFLTGNKELASVGDEVIFMKKYSREGYVVNDTTWGNFGINTTNYLNKMKKGNDDK